MRCGSIDGWQLTNAHLPTLESATSPNMRLQAWVPPMIHCTDLIRALEHYSRGYGDRTSIDRLLAMARRNLEDPRIFAWQRDRLNQLVAVVEASVGGVVEPDMTDEPVVIPPQVTGSRPSL